jgi:hypothetical protein
MKNLLVLALLGTFTFALTGCGADPVTPEVDDVIAGEELTPEVEVEVPAVEEEVVAGEEEISPEIAPEVEYDEITVTPEEVVVE